jgi:hypothetical protein
MTASSTVLHGRRLGTYLNDHLAAATAGVEVARRTTASNAGTPYEATLREVCDHLEADKRLLRELMRALEVDEDRFKRGAAWLGEKLGRLKPNDSLTSYSPLSRVIELEALVVVRTVLRGTWTTLDELLGDDLRVPDVAAARDRAGADLEALEALRPDAAREALTA